MKWETVVYKKRAKKIRPQKEATHEPQVKNNAVQVNLPKQKKIFVIKSDEERVTRMKLLHPKDLKVLKNQKGSSSMQVLRKRLMK
ncbi:Hypothetical protein FKW44_024053 [Caligus rogercresseyi]|uniref:Uncharacterized protein n=1 Tax=Caligus rogercresseyi TaxID=217165 RepID=A0A7T8GPY5_CALRO|nr:Hypothetical protein FKW44_024053 [Caligus rogercresseyi]